MYLRCCFILHCVPSTYLIAPKRLLERIMNIFFLPFSLSSSNCLPVKLFTSRRECYIVFIILYLITPATFCFYIVNFTNTVCLIQLIYLINTFDISRSLIPFIQLCWGLSLHLNILRNWRIQPKISVSLTVQSILKIHLCLTLLWE